MDKLIPIVTDNPVRPRQVAASSIPGMCALFQNEWDALMLETFELKKQLEQVLVVGCVLLAHAPLFFACWGDIFVGIFCPEFVHENVFPSTKKQE